MSSVAAVNSRQSVRALETPQRGFYVRVVTDLCRRGAVSS